MTRLTSTGTQKQSNRGRIQPEKQSRGPVDGDREQHRRQAGQHPDDDREREEQLVFAQPKLQSKSARTSLPIGFVAPANQQQRAVEGGRPAARVNRLLFDTVDQIHAGLD